MKNFELAKKSAMIRKARNTCYNEISKTVTDVFTTVGKEWARKYPKRKLEFVVGMGTVFWVIDGEILHTSWENGYNNNGEMTYSNTLNFSYKNWYNISGIAENIFKPLLRAEEWLDSVTESGEYLDKYFLNDIKF